MKLNNLRAFNKHLQNASPTNYADLYLILGKDDYERKEGINSLLNHLGKEKNAIKKYQGGQVNISNLLDDLNSFSFFSEKRAILVDEFDKMTKPSLEKLEKYFANPNQSTYLILSASSINRATRVYKNAEKAGVILDLVEEKPWQKQNKLKEWIQNRASIHGKMIDSGAVRILLQLLGNEQSLIHQELDKLICYIGSREKITVRDIGDVCTCVNLENVWQLGEAIFRRDGNAALRISKTLLSDGTHLIMLLRQVRNQFQTEFQVCSILMNGGNSQDVSIQFPYMKGHILDRHIQMAKHYGMDRFKNGLILIDEAEMQAKNSAQNPDWIAEILMVKLTS